MKYYRIYNTASKKHMRWDDGRFLMFKYAKQAQNYIERRLGNSPVMKIVDWEVK
jgi:hypothetical protein